MELYDNQFLYSNASMIKITLATSQAQTARGEIQVSTNMHILQEFKFMLR